MLIGLIGYGKMGQAVEKIAVQKDHDVAILGQRQLDDQLVKRVECAIDFSNASFAPSAIAQCLERGINVVSGTTGWTSDVLDELKEQAAKPDSGAFCWSPNFSIGMQIVFALNRTLARIMDEHDQYNPHILETHRKEKADAPSGTAIALGEQMVAYLSRIEKWVAGESDDVSTMPILSEREGDVKGIHRISYSSPFDTVSLRHHALSRDGFAYGAVVAAERLWNRKGFVSFAELINFTGVA